MITSINQHEKIPTQGNCLRCGECCRQGGPCFHQEDIDLIRSKTIPLSDLFTIRQGETVYENVKDFLGPADNDLIKIKSRKGERTCIYLDTSTSQALCRIYDNRPLECRVLNCRDTRESEKIYARNRLTRKDLIGDIVWLWDIVTEHQQRCDFIKLGGLVGKLNSDQQDQALEAIRENLAYDRHIRSITAEKAGISMDTLDFIFGRPLTETFVMFGLKVMLDENGYHLKQSSHQFMFNTSE